MTVFFFGIAPTFLALVMQPVAGTGWPLVPAILAGVLGTCFALDAAHSLERLDILWPPGDDAIGRVPAAGDEGRRPHMSGT